MISMIILLVSIVIEKKFLAMKLLLWCRYCYNVDGVNDNAYIDPDIEMNLFDERYLSLTCLFSIFDIISLDWQII